jgi:hypothetical protein
LFDYYQTRSTNPHHQEVNSVNTHFQAHRRTWITAAILVVVAVAVVLLVAYAGGGSGGGGVGGY